MNLRISSPCPESWDEMAGDDRIRFCGRCNLNVYNLAVMSREEIEALVRNTNGRLCGRLYLRGNRKATRSDCGAGRRFKLVRRAAALAVVLVIGAVSWMLRKVEEPDRSIHPPLIRKALGWIEPERKRTYTMLMGEVAMPSPPTPPPAPPVPIPTPEPTP
jgi:hypothetical protein